MITIMIMMIIYHILIYHILLYIYLAGGRREPRVVRNDYNSDNDDIIYINISYAFIHIPCRGEEGTKGGES